MTYHDKTLCMRVAPVSINQYDSFVPADGVARNFKLRISGPIEDRDNIYYGGEVCLFYTGIPRMRRSKSDSSHWDHWRMEAPERPSFVHQRT